MLDPQGKNKIDYIMLDPQEKNKIDYTMLDHQDKNKIDCIMQLEQRNFLLHGYSKTGVPWSGFPF